MTDNPQIIEPRNLLYKWDIIKLKDKLGNVLELTVESTNDYWVEVCTADWKIFQLPRAFFLKQEDGSYIIYW